MTLARNDKKKRRTNVQSAVIKDQAYQSPSLVEGSAPAAASLGGA
jgi:hypothetical protein